MGIKEELARIKEDDLQNQQLREIVWKIGALDRDIKALQLQRLAFETLRIELTGD